MTASKRDKDILRKRLAKMTTNDLNSLVAFYVRFPFAYKRDTMDLAKEEQRFRMTFKKMTDTDYDPAKDSHR